MRYIAIVIVMVAVLVLAMMQLSGAARSTAGQVSTSGYAHDIQAAQNLVRSQTSPTP